MVQAIELIQSLQGTEEVELVLTRIADSTDACNDKPVWALNQIMVMHEIAHARGDRAKLRDVGRRVFNLEVVHKHAKQKCDSLRFVDDVCVYLKFEIELREALDLPVSALAMHFPNYIKVDPAEIEAAREQALSIPDDRFQAWLLSWSEWQRQLRFEKRIDYNSLPVVEAKKRTSWRKSIRNLLGDKPSDTVVFKGQRCSLSDLYKHWVATGRDLFTNAPLSAEDLDMNLFRIM